MDEGRPPDPEPGVAPTDGTPIDGAPDAGVPDAGVPDDGNAAPTEEVALDPRRPGRGLVAIAVVLVAAIVVFAVVGGRIATSSGPDASRPVPRLAITDADGRLRTMDADGGAVVDHDAPGVHFSFPAWSPDGTRIAANGEELGDIRLYLFDATASGPTEPKLLYDDPSRPPFYLYWSPDGRQIAFLTSEPAGIALRLVPVDGSAEARVVREGSPLYWDWLGNDHLVTHIGSSGAGSFLGEVDLDGASTEAVPLEAGFFRSPAVSHDGTYRAYVTTGQDTTGVVTLESIDRSSRQIAPVFGVAAVSFDPKGTTLAYVAADRPQAQEIAFPLGPLKALDPASGDTRTLLGGDVVAFFWSPDGKTIAALTLNPPDDEIVGVPGSGLVSAAGPRPAAGDDPPQAGVPLTLAFVDVASGSIRSSHATQITSRFVNNILPYYDQYALSHRVWAPDSSAVALPLVEDGIDMLFVIPADGSEATMLEGAELGFWRP